MRDCPNESNNAAVSGGRPGRRGLAGVGRRGRSATARQRRKGIGGLAASSPGWSSQCIAASRPTTKKPRIAAAAPDASAGSAVEPRSSATR